MPGYKYLIIGGGMTADATVSGTRRDLAQAIFEWIEAWYNPHRRHTSIGDLSPIDYERLYTPVDAA